MTAENKTGLVRFAVGCRTAGSLCVFVVRQGKAIVEMIRKDRGFERWRLVGVDDVLRRLAVRVVALDRDDVIFRVVIFSRANAGVQLEAAVGCKVAPDRREVDVVQYCLDIELSERHGLKQALCFAPSTRRPIGTSCLGANCWQVPARSPRSRWLREAPTRGLFISGDAMQWIEAIINVTAFVGFIGIASIAKPQQAADEIPASAQDSHVL
jgi:hypothetical protein